MPDVVKLDEVIEAMDLPDDWEAFLDPDTGEILTVTDEDRSVLDEEEDDEDLEVQKLRKLLASGRALPLPGKFDIHEWDLMRRFASTVPDLDESSELLRAIHGTGAFRMFKATLARLGLREGWFEFRDRAFREMAREWLEAQGIEYIEDAEKRTSLRVAQLVEHGDSGSCRVEPPVTWLN